MTALTSEQEALIRATRTQWPVAYLPLIGRINESDVSKWPRKLGKRKG